MPFRRNVFLLVDAVLGLFQIVKSPNTCTQTTKYFQKFMRNKIIKKFKSRILFSFVFLFSKKNTVRFVGVICLAIDFEFIICTSIFYFEGKFFSNSAIFFVS